MSIFFFLGGGGVWRFCWYSLWGHHKAGIISMHLRVFSWGQCTKWRYFLGLLKFQIFFFGMPGPIFYGVNSRCWVQAYLWRKKWEHPPSGMACPKNLPCGTLGTTEQLVSFQVTPVAAQFNRESRGRQRRYNFIQRFPSRQYFLR